MEFCSAQFKPNTQAFTIYPNSQQPRYVEYISGEEQRTAQINNISA